MTSTRATSAEALPDLTAEAERGSSLRGLLHRFAHEYRDEPLVAIALPYLAALFSSASEVAPLIAGRIGAPRLWRTYENMKAWTAARTPFFVAGDLVAAIATLNQARSLTGPLQQFGAHRRARHVRPPPRRIGRLSRQGDRLGADLLTAIDDSACPMPVHRLEVRHAFSVAAAILALAEATLAKNGVRAVVLGSAHGLAPRALALVARLHGIASVYIPHAPVIRDAELADLPVDYAALRGPAEVDYYMRMGIDASRLAVAGDTSIDQLPPPPILDPGKPAVFAPPGIPREQLDSVVSMIMGATSDQMIVSPHPLINRREVSSAVPAGWPFWRGRTFDLLKAGHPLLLQGSSGVALEALQLGLPTIELSFPGIPATYPFIDEPYIPHVSDSEALSGALEDARRAGASDERRGALIDWSKRWVAATGEEAANRAASLINRARLEGPVDEPIWNAWPGGPR